MLELCGFMASKSEVSRSDIIPLKQFFFPLKFLLNISRKSTLPSNSDKIQQGGFGAVTVNNIPFKYNNPFNEFFSEFSNNLLLTFKFFNFLWEPQVSQHIYSFYPSFFNVDPHYYSYALEEPKIVPHQHPRYILIDTLNQVQSNAIALLKNVIKNQTNFYSNPEIAKMITQTLFYNIQNLPNQKLRDILHLFTRIVEHCPPAAFLHVVAPLLSKLVPFYVNRIDKCWNDKTNPDFDPTSKKLPFHIWALIPEDCEIETSEIIYTRTLEDITLAFFEFLHYIAQSLVLPNTSVPQPVNIFETNPNIDTPPVNANLEVYSKFFFTNEGEDTMKNIIKSLCFTIIGEQLQNYDGSLLKTWDEKQAFTKSLSIIESITPFLVSQPKFHVYASELFKSLLITLTRRFYFEHKNSIIRCLFFLYLNFAKLKIPPVQILLSNGIPQEKINKMNELFTTKNPVKQTILLKNFSQLFLDIIAQDTKTTPPKIKEPSIRLQKFQKPKKNKPGKNNRKKGKNKSKKAIPNLFL
eukprot:TRINITY_DN1724_c0_g1_i1.p1 TRINITY_DN1724_c0_g1~~TRINITY_DN1724_c0_g1_i1.p1  ORF type:complete len:522 (+),score=184.80 TRINITY_DN1724_c0_g1_i1:120-1685(+)